MSDWKSLGKDSYNGNNVVAWIIADLADVHSAYV